MKTFISALGLACLASGQEVDNPFMGSMLGDFLGDLGITQDTTNINLESPMAKYPKVQAFGWDSTLDSTVNSALTSTDGNWGMAIGVNFDIGGYYELPLYNQNNYLVWRQRIGVYAGGRQYISFLLGNVFRLTLYGDIWITKVTFFDNYMRMDIVNYNDFCDAMQYIIDVLRFQFLFQLDVNECIWGLVGQITGNTQDC